MLSSPAELRKLSQDQLRDLADDIRQQIIGTCLKNGGHLGASLGAVEIAIALHRVFESPRDTLIWDVGHQAYAHKLLTGRWERFPTLRKTGGLSGFLSRDESEHDFFGAGHSSTSLSAALASAWSKAREARVGKSDPRWTAAVIGDGGLTAGVAFEALNNFRAENHGPLLVVVNDNQMSISPNVGAIPAILSGGEAAEFFGLFGADYVGPVDGHDLPTLIGVLEGVKKNYAGRPVVVHALTQKGKGYAPAEESPAVFHGVGPVREKLPAEKEVASAKDSFSERFGKVACALAEKDPRVVVVTAAMAEGTGLLRFAQLFPDRFFDVGIAEPHAVTFAAGLAAQGWKPIVAIYSTFLQRALDAVIHDVCLQRLPVAFAIDRAGIVGADGPTHHGAFDIAYLGAVPELSLDAPEALSDLEPLFAAALTSGRPSAIRYPRGSGPESREEALEGGIRISGSLERGPWVIAAGAAATRARQAIAKIPDFPGTLISAVQLKPISETLLRHLKNHPTTSILTIEDGSRRGGFGEALRDAAGNRSGRFEILGYPDRFLPHGSPADVELAAGVSVEALRERIAAFVTAKS